jgi:hypothetical protein
MKILSICQDDFANFMYDNMKALLSVGLDCDCVKLQKHSFYEEQAEIVSYESLLHLIASYDIIQFFHDNSSLWSAITPEILDKKVIVYHTSSDYRKNYKVKNQLMKGAWKHIACMPEFVVMCPGSIYMVGAVDTDKLRPREFITGSDIIFGHYPSNPTVKGTAKIIEMMRNIEVHFRYSDDGAIVPHESQLAMMAACDVYIEMFADKDGLGSVYGNFGITALEAGALGRLVVTQCKDIEVYRKHYGETFFYPVTDENDFLSKIEMLNSMSENDIKEEQILTRETLVRNHSYKATGNYFIKNVLNGK